MAHLRFRLPTKLRQTERRSYGLAAHGKKRDHPAILPHTKPVDGWAFRRAQVEQEVIAGIPVVVMSAGYSAHSEATKLAATAAPEKPFDLDVVLDIVAASLG